MSLLQAIRYNNHTLEILDQIQLPTSSKYMPVRGVHDGWLVIKNMHVRGAPAIAIVGCLSLAVDLAGHTYHDKDQLLQDIIDKMNYLTTARPTAVNIKTSREMLIKLATDLTKQSTIDVTTMKHAVISAIENMLDKDLADNKAIGDNGAQEIFSVCPVYQLRILTHCNTGSLATSGYGTALGVIRSIYTRNRLEHVYCTETRPYNQGARLTAYELVHDNIPATLIADSMVAALMQTKQISAVVVGADRVAANGDTANKIGTYQIAVLAKFHNVPFFVAAPFTSIDPNIPTGESIAIELRPAKELSHIGDQQIAPDGITIWNPAFDVTPAELITGIVTEERVYRPCDLLKRLQAK